VYGETCVSLNHFEKITENTGYNLEGTQESAARVFWEDLTKAVKEVTALSEKGK